MGKQMGKTREEMEKQERKKVSKRMELHCRYNARGEGGGGGIELATNAEGSQVGLKNVVPLNNLLSFINQQ